VLRPVRRDRAELVNATDDDPKVAECKPDQTKSDVEQAGEHAKDTFKH
jgi:uncharacterized protein YjbJ (UPF0337 family)